ncbi:MAG: tetratricopeptide repeat protein [Gemmataceae bacterium]|nr:tetratricopeptide repeat protein [Gemmataceae bacterium]
MATSLRLGLVFSILLAIFAAELRSQQPVQTDRPTVFVPLKPESRAELQRREALKLYTLGLLRQRQDRLLDALTTFEEALQLDPEAVAIHRGLIALYLALGRTDDALKSCRQTLDRAPGDYETWHLYGRQLRDQGKTKDAIAALERGVACPAAQEHLDILVQMHYDLGQTLENEREFGKAETAYNEVVKILVGKRQALVDSGPFNPEQLDAEAAKTYERLGHICIEARKYDKAITAFVEAQKRDPDRAGRLNFNLAEVCLAQDKPADALPYLDQYLRTQPQGDQPYELKINILKKLKREREILPMLAQSAERDQRNLPLQLLLAKQYGREKQWAEAERRYLKVGEDSPSPDVYRGLFNLYKDQAKEQNTPAVMGKALTVLDQALVAASPKDDNGPGNAAAATRARSMLAVLRDDGEVVKAMLTEAIGELRNRKERAYETWRLLGALAVHCKQLDHAEQLYKHCLTRITQQTEGEVYGGLLDVLNDQGKHEDVVKYGRDGLRKAQATNRVLFHVKIAPSLIQLGKIDEAVAEAEEAVKLADDRNRLRIYRFKVSVLTQVEKYDKAIETCQAMLKEFSQPGDVRDVRYALSSVYSAARLYAKAEEQLRLILQGDPNDATANNDLGYIMADQSKNLEESEQLIRKAIDLDRQEKKIGTEVRAEGDGDNAAYLDSLGWVLFRRGKMDEAKSWLEKAVALPGGDDPVLWDHLGDVYFRLKEPARARTAWEKSITLFEKEKRRRPDDRSKEVKQKLRMVDGQR